VWWPFPTSQKAAEEKFKATDSKWLLHAAFFFTTLILREITRPKQIKAAFGALDQGLMMWEHLRLCYINFNLQGDPKVLTYF
jgi:hypothetical protein